MIPMQYEDIKHWEDLNLELDDGTEIVGKFTDMRIDRETVPPKLYAYDLRDADADGEICQLKTYVLVNHYGTFITNKKIKNANKGRTITDYGFYYQ